MADDYLWDRTGPVDPEIAALEARLAPLRMPEPLRAPVHPPLGPRARPTRRESPWGTIGVAAMTAAATAALIWAWIHGTAPSEPTTVPATITIDASVHEPEPVSVGAPPPAIAPPPAHSDAASPPSVETPRPETPSPETPRVETPTPAARPGAARPATRKRPAPRPEAPMPVPSAVASLPDTPSATDVRTAIAAVKELARACGPAHGAAPGERVTVKITIEGATGLVTSANALGEHRSTPLGNCVADALARAEFPRFAKASIGVQYPITMPN